MSHLLAIIWNFKPEIFPNLDFPVLGNIRYYGLLWALSFIAANWIVGKMYQKEKLKIQELDVLFMYTLIGCIVGARLGHCLFYGPFFDEIVDGKLIEGYLSHPLNILKVWEGGLASHGGGIGLIVACFLFQRKFKSQSFKSVLDKVAITVALAGCFIRLGNFLNSEIIGKPTDNPFGVAFVENVTGRLTHPDNYGKSIEKIEFIPTAEDSTFGGVRLEAYIMQVTFNPEIQSGLENESVFRYLDKDYIIDSHEGVKIAGDTISTKVYLVTRHPAQLYESISCLLLFILMLYLYFHVYDGKIPEGLFIGLFLVYVFVLRFFYEYLKENQEAHEDGWIINTGQILSIPAVILGAYYLFCAFKRKKENI